MKKLLMILLLLSVTMTFTTTASAAIVQWSGNGHWYEAVYEAWGIDWDGATTAATAKGGYLATSTSGAENSFLFTLINDSKYWYNDGANNSEGPWLGGYQSSKTNEPTGDWTWVSGETWSWTNWKTGEPNNSGGNEDYLVFFEWGLNTMASTWNDVGRGALEKGYIIEYNTNPVPVPAAVWLLGSGLIGLAGIRRKFKH
jgi:hypothetical protein